MMEEQINEIIEDLKRIRMRLYPRSTLANRAGDLELMLCRDITALESVLNDLKRGEKK